MLYSLAFRGKGLATDFAKVGFSTVLGINMITQKSLVEELLVALVA